MWIYLLHEPRYTKNDRNLNSDYGLISSIECQSSAPTSQTCYASAPNDIWSLGVILVNLTCGRNPWKRASVDDATFRAYLKDSKFLSSILPISSELECILRRIFECNPAKRISIPELRQLILQCKFFSAPPKAPQTPPPEDFQAPPYEPPVVVHPFDNPFEALYTPPPTPPAPVTFSKPISDLYSSESAVDSDSDYDSDDDSVFSSGSSVSDMDEPSLCPPTPIDSGLARPNFYFIPPTTDLWRKPGPYPSFAPSIQCC